MKKEDIEFLEKLRPFGFPTLKELGIEADKNETPNVSGDDKANYVFEDELF